jgi:uncharacterized protein (DUF1778 family)
MTNASSTASIVSVRVSPAQRAILEAAAEYAHTNISDFVRRKAIEAAEVDVSQRTTVTTEAKDWEAFEAWASRPAEPIAALRELAQRSRPGSGRMRAVAAPQTLLLTAILDCIVNHIPAKMEPSGDLLG